MKINRINRWDELVSTIEYYRILNETTSHMVGDTQNARIIVYSVDFQHIIKLQQQAVGRKQGQYLRHCSRKH